MMQAKISHGRITSLLLFALVVLGAGGLFYFQKDTAAVASPVTTLASPANGAVYKASSSGTAAVSFSAKAVDADSWERLKLLVMYRKVGEVSWHSYGSIATTAPNGKPSIFNGIRNQFINERGWNCAMGWGTVTKPASCDVIWSNGSKTGYPAWSGTNVYYPNVNLTAGTYEWTARGYDNANYGPWAATRRFSVSAYVPPVVTKPTPKPAPNPTPTPAPTRKTTPKVVSPTASAPEAVEDKEPPTVPGNLFGVFNPEENSINLNWDGSTDNTQLAGYEVERTESGAEKWSKIGDATEESFVDFKFEPQKSYQYRVRSFDPLQNFSAYSNVVEVAAGDFFPNITAAEGGVVTEGLVTVDAPAGSSEEDLFIIINKIDQPNLNLDSNTKLVGDVYEIKAKNSKGAEVTKFKTQIAIKIRYDKKAVSGVSASTTKMANFIDEKTVFITSSLDAKNQEVKTLTDHLSVYFLTAKKTSPWMTFLKILLWILLILALAAGGWYLYILYKRQQYQKEHRDDYIYRS